MGQIPENEGANVATFYTYFKENMDSLGLPAPLTLFSSAQAAVANVTIILAHIDKFGRAVSVGEVIGAAEPAASFLACCCAAPIARPISAEGLGYPGASLCEGGAVKDNGLLLLAGLLFSTAAWFFWYVFGAEAMNVLATISLIVVTADNVRLRRRLHNALRHAGEDNA